MQAMNRYDFRARIYFLTGVMNLILAIPLGIKYGGVGCAVATGISMIVGNGFIMNWYYAKEIHLAIASFWRQIGRISLVTGICLMIGYAANVYFGPQGGIGPFILKAVMYTILYMVMIYAFAMNRMEREKILAVFRKLHIR